MQMRAGRMSGLSHITHDISGIHCPSFTHPLSEARKMSITRHVPAGMDDVHNIAVALTPADKVYTPFPDRDYRSSSGSRIVDAHVRSRSAGDWILPAQTIRRRNSDVAQRGTQKGAARRSPVAVIIGAAPVAGHVIESAERIISRLELRGQDSSQRPAAVRIT